jgi:NAD-dependent deacetylase
MMLAPNRHAAIEQLSARMADAKRVVALTGAGISTECGSPDFRSPGGLWTQNRPIPFDEFRASQDARNEAWRRKFVIDEKVQAARPGRGHRALARLAAAGKITAIITQNIDNLHQQSGVPESHIIELHGNGSYATCLDCAVRYELDWVRERFTASGGIAPDCPACSGPVKSATISFGQAMPVQQMRLAESATLATDLFLAIGSSLVVWPAAGFPAMAKRNGARLVILNREPTDQDRLADLVVHEDIGDVLEPFAR